MTAPMLTSPDLTDGEQVQMEVVDGSGVTFIRVIASAGTPGSGTVTDVTGTAPIVITGSPTTTPNVTITAATEAAAGSMSAADKTKLDGMGPGAAVASVTASSPLASSGGANPNITLASTITVPEGGTGDTTFTAHGVLVGAGASAIGATSAGTAGQVLTSNGATLDPTFQPVPAASPGTWTDEAAGAAVAVAAQAAPQFFFQDTAATAASGTYSFPAHGTAVDGQEVTITLSGNAVNTPVNLAPGTGNIMADPNNAGQFGGSGATLVATQPGAVVRLKYKDLGASGAWRPR